MGMGRLSSPNGSRSAMKWPFTYCIKDVVSHLCVWQAPGSDSCLPLASSPQLTSCGSRVWCHPAVSREAPYHACPKGSCQPKRGQSCTLYRVLDGMPGRAKACLICTDQKEEALALLNALIGDSCCREGRNLAPLLIRMVGLGHSLWRYPLLCAGMCAES